MARPIIAVDIDDVLFPFSFEMTRYHNAEYGTSFKVDNYQSMDYSDEWGDTPKVATDKIHRFLALDQRQISPVTYAHEALEVLSGNYDLVIVTSRHEQFRVKSEGWLHHYFPETFRDIHMVGNPHSGGTFMTKGLMCQQIGAEYLIDDNLDYATECAETGVKVLLFGDYPWNKAQKLSRLIRRVQDWREAVTALMEENDDRA